MENEREYDSSGIKATALAPEDYIVRTQQRMLQASSDWKGLIQSIWKN